MIILESQNIIKRMETYQTNLPAASNTPAASVGVENVSRHTSDVRGS